MPERRFRDMRLTESDVEERIHANIELCERKIRWDCDHLGVGDEPDTSELVAFVDRAKRLLPLWREWSIERERLWFALIGLGLDIEGDTRDMSRAEMRRRIENESKRSLQALFVLQEVRRG